MKCEHKYIKVQYVLMTATVSSNTLLEREGSGKSILSKCVHHI